MNSTKKVLPRLELDEFIIIFSVMVDCGASSMDTLEILCKKFDSDLSSLTFQSLSKSAADEGQFFINMASRSGNPLEKAFLAQVAVGVLTGMSLSSLREMAQLFKESRLASKLSVIREERDKKEIENILRDFSKAFGFETDVIFMHLWGK